MSDEAPVVALTRRELAQVVGWGDCASEHGLGEGFELHERLVATLDVLEGCTTYEDSFRDWIGDDEDVARELTTEGIRERLGACPGCGAGARAGDGR